MARMYDIPSGIAPEYLATILMYDYADQVRIKDSNLRHFDSSWKELVQPVIDKKEPPRDNPRQWESFALTYHYLSGEGFHLPLYSKPWAAAIRSFLSILGTDCPSNLRNEGPPQWSSEIRDPKLSPPLLNPTEAQIGDLKKFLNGILVQSENYSLEWIIGKIVDEDWEAIPNDYSVAAHLREGIVAHQRPAGEQLKFEPMQSLLLDMLRTGDNTNDFLERYEKARTASLAAQVKVMIQSLSGKRGNQWIDCSMEELAGCLLQRKEPGISSSLDPNSDQTGRSLIPAKSQFPGRLTEADWLLNDRQLRKPPDPLKMWIAYNWVNPQAPFWMMKASAIYDLLQCTRLEEATSNTESLRKKLEQGRIREAIKYLELPKSDQTPPINDFRPNQGWVTNGFAAERIHEMASVSINGITNLGAAKVTRENFSKLAETVDPELLKQLFYAN